MIFMKKEMVAPGLTGLGRSFHHCGTRIKNNLNGGAKTRGIVGSDKIVQVKRSSQSWSHMDPTLVWCIAEVSVGDHHSCSSSCVTCWVRNDLIFLKLFKAKLGDSGYMIRKSQAVSNHDSKISNSIGRGKGQGVNFDVNVVMMVVLAVIPGGPQWRADEDIQEILNECPDR